MAQRKTKTSDTAGRVHEPDSRLDSPPDGLIVSRDDLVIIQAALPWLALMARKEAAEADLIWAAKGVGRVAELSSHDHLRRQADAAMSLYERISDFLHHKQGGP